VASILSKNEDSKWVNTSNLSLGVATTVATVFGATCDSLDLILSEVTLPIIERGDYIRFNRMGAYTYSASSEFNGIPNAVIYNPLTMEIQPKIEEE